MGLDGVKVWATRDSDEGDDSCYALFMGTKEPEFQEDVWFSECDECWCMLALVPELWSAAGLPFMVKGDGPTPIQLDLIKTLDL